MSTTTRNRADATTVDAPTLARSLAAGLTNSLPPTASTFEERYVLESELGEGGMGVVKLSLDRIIGRRVAMKIVREGSGSSRSSDGAERFVREARVQGQLEHPAIVPVYDLGVDPSGRAFFTMKRVRGTTLHDVLNRVRDEGGATDARFSRRRLLSAFGSVCLAVDYAHQHGVIHRDLKPSNLMLGDFGEVYALDWGLARLAGTDQAPSSAVDLDIESGKTIAGAVMGTPGYMAPEQARGDGDAIGPWTDVFALGCILYEILTLEPLIQGPPGELLEKTIAGVDARASVRAPDARVPPELEALVIRATMLDPGERLASARAMSDALEAFLDGERDVEVRREMASRHAESARDAADRARTEDSPGFEQRRDALREVSRALALDPSNSLALDTLVRLMTEQPRRLPPEVAIELAGNERHRIRRVGRIGGIAYLSTLLYLPFFVWVGVRDWRWVLAFYACAALAAAASLSAALRKNPSTLEVFGAMVASSIAFAATATFFGPLVLTPTLVAVNTMGFSLNLSRKHRWWAIALGILAIAVPALLLSLGVLPGGYSFDGNTMVTSAGAIHLPRVPSILLLVTVAIGSVLTGSLSVTRVRDALDEAERQLFLYAWHLREFIPEAARASTDPTGVRRAMRERRR